MTPGGGWASAGPCPSLRCGAGDEASQMRATGSGHIDARIPAPKIILGNERTSGRAIHGHFPERCAGTGLAKCEAETGPGAYRGIQRCRRSMPRPPSVAWSPVDSALLIVPEPAARELAQDFLGRACEVVAVQRLALVESSRCQQCLGELVLADLASKHDCAVTLTTPVRAFLFGGGGRACEHDRVDYFGSATSASAAIAGRLQFCSACPGRVSIDDH